MSDLPSPKTLALTLRNGPQIPSSNYTRGKIILLLICPCRGGELSTIIAKKSDTISLLEIPRSIHTYTRHKLQSNKQNHFYQTVFVTSDPLEKRAAIVNSESYSYWLQAFSLHQSCMS